MFVFAVARGGSRMRQSHPAPPPNVEARTQNPEPRTQNAEHERRTRTKNQAPRSVNGVYSVTFFIRNGVLPTMAVISAEKR